MSERRAAAPRGVVVRIDGDWSHGTCYAYDKKGCRCEPCRVAGSDARKARRAAAIQRAGVTDHPHGVGGYNDYRCRCDVCVAARARYARRYMDRSEYFDGPRVRATRKYARWTGPDLEAALRPDLTASECADLLGRTVHSIMTMRQKLRHDGSKFVRMVTGETT